ncbi:GSCFA domain-containing protein [Maribacter sp. HTCC2170]|uniref:GSCFA domain-containing protein n=1 Tax=Maribacter sp. (strain HTCC2170 / KCCM 42371) TaxID=313603 RepID=UPI00006AE64E|nr:GSCFA domain-containing protein [Maribacter sp. HTCC2170]EAR00601.1 hypothetical protein FB2170_08849 [Maribacter sp. HTCC2170]
MKLQTKVPLQIADNQIDYQSNLLLLGSCFVENIGGKLGYYKFNKLQNPFGILFHPAAIEKSLTRSIEKRLYTEDDVFFFNERWHCFDAHSELSDPSIDKLLGKLNQVLDSLLQQIVKSSHIVITLGTAWVYRHVQENKTVANCHKVPQREFKKELLSVDEISESLGHMIQLVQSVNSKAQFVFTISPVRHLKDGFVENQLSKAHLITAIGQLMTASQEVDKIHYFPSYEIMMDELRDYRFYNSDMVHPNDVAVEYIWEKFKSVWISKEAFPIMDKIQEIQRSLKHRPFNPDSSEHQKFLKTLNTKIQVLQVDFPQMKF